MDPDTNKSSQWIEGDGPPCSTVTCSTAAVNGADGAEVGSVSTCLVWDGEWQPGVVGSEGTGQAGDCHGPSPALCESRELMSRAWSPASSSMGGWFTLASVSTQ